jgi:hypothetical protein
VTTLPLLIQTVVLSTLQMRKLRLRDSEGPMYSERSQVWQAGQARLELALDGCVSVLWPHCASPPTLSPRELAPSPWFHPLAHPGKRSKCEQAEQVWVSGELKASSPSRDSRPSASASASSQGLQGHSAGPCPLASHSRAWDLLCLGQAQGTCRAGGGDGTMFSSPQPSLGK